MNALNNEADFQRKSRYGHGIPSQAIIGQGHESFLSVAALESQKPAPADEDSVIERLKAGDQEALETLFNRYAPKLYNVAHRILGNVPDAEEVIQDVFWTAYRKAETFRGQSQFSTWLYRLTINTAVGKIRRRKKNQRIEYHEFLPKFQKDGHHLSRPVVDWSNLPDEEYAKGELRQILSKALDQLKPLDKTIVVLSDLEGLAYKEIAAVLRVTISTVKTRLHRARLFLRGKLAAHLGHWVSEARSCVALPSGASKTSEGIQ